MYTYMNMYIDIDKQHSRRTRRAGTATKTGCVEWGLCPCCPDVGRCLSGVYNHHHQAGLCLSI